MLGECDALELALLWPFDSAPSAPLVGWCRPAVVVVVVVVRRVLYDGDDSIGGTVGLRSSPVCWSGAEVMCTTAAAAVVVGLIGGTCTGMVSAVVLLVVLVTRQLVLDCVGGVEVVVDNVVGSDSIDGALLVWVLVVVVAGWCVGERMWDTTVVLVDCVGTNSALPAAATVAGNGGSGAECGCRKQAHESVTSGMGKNDCE